jgi:hypothetical protein
MNAIAKVTPWRFGPAEHDLSSIPRKDDEWWCWGNGSGVVKSDRQVPAVAFVGNNHARAFTGIVENHHHDYNNNTLCPSGIRCPRRREQEQQQQDECAANR